MEAKHAALMAAHAADDDGDEAMSAFSSLADECRMAAEESEKDGKAEHAARFRKIEKEARARCARRSAHVKVVNTMNHLQMAESLEHMAHKHKEAGHEDDAAMCTEMAKHHREKHEEIMREEHRKEAAKEVEAQVKPVKTDVDSKIATLTSLLNDSKKQLAAVQDRELKAAAKQAVEAAIADGKLAPAQREWAISICIKSPEDFQAYLKNAIKLPTGIENFEAERHVTVNGSAVAVSANELEIAAQFQNVSPEDYAKMRAMNQKQEGAVHYNSSIARMVAHS